MACIVYEGNKLKYPTINKRDISFLKKICLVQSMSCFIYSSAACKKGTMMTTMTPTNTSAMLAIDSSVSPNS